MSVFDLQLETERLVLRPPRAEDLDAWAAFATDEEAMRHLGGTMPRSVAWRSLATVVGAWQMQQFGFFFVFEKATGDWVGRVGPWQPEGWPGTEVGWGIKRDRWGLGYAPEAASAAIDWVLGQHAWDEVIHTIAPDNQASKQVAAKLGSRLLRMGVMPAPYDGQSVEIWGQSRAEWQAKGARA
ncbi:Protein N-acetyltransferase, RimJ/RimL family [Pseudoxanthomonas sp. GM95]|uniref:GNAT family N-acetyltransferase n=1 Tax=Pseudoxanthomonas sp. GM95 TaxID=1881043 RepID=UPI0008C36DD5|nr:GNAT family N-acetyltransferase [Pseudoxanthomonas sp. GM95]SEK99960.1 Protein N-acetyltransferase, RimJ/RimL family [Pseudoxanthomonas sp. GM95]